MPHAEREHELMIEIARLTKECNALHVRALTAEECAKRESEMRWGMENERGEVNAALKVEMARADAAESALAAARRECEGWTAENAALWARIRTLELDVAIHDAAKARAEAALEKAEALAAPASAPGEETTR